MSRRQTHWSVTACLVPHTVIPLLHNLQLTHFCVTTHAEASALRFPCTAERERQFTLGEADTLKPMALSSQTFGIFRASSLAHSASAGQVETQTHDITTPPPLLFNRARQNNSRTEGRKSLLCDYCGRLRFDVLWEKRCRLIPQNKQRHRQHHFHFLQTAFQHCNQFNVHSLHCD